MSKKLFKLDYEESYDFLLMAIFTGSRHYKLCYEINNVLEIGFERIADFENHVDKKASRGAFPLFRYYSTDEEEYFIIGNKGTIAIFIPEYKQVDFFLMIRNPSRYTTSQIIINKLKQLKQVSSIIEVDPKKVKSADNFLLINFKDVK
jgi:hypothetical protein